MHSFQLTLYGNNNLIAKQKKQLNLAHSFEKLNLKIKKCNTIKAI